MDFISYDFKEGQIVELFHGRPQAAWEIDSAPDKVLREVIAWAERQKEFDDYERADGDISAIELVRKHIPADRLAEVNDQMDEIRVAYREEIKSGQFEGEKLT